MTDIPEFIDCNIHGSAFECVVCGACGEHIDPYWYGGEHDCELTPQFMPILSSGAHASPKEGACIMEYASFLNGEAWSDRPSCTHPVLAVVARSVNDKLDDDRRQELLPLLPRLMGTAGGDEVLSVRLAVWCAQQVAHLNTDDRVRVAIESALAWCDNPCEETAAAAANAAAAAAAANAAANAVAATYAATAAATAAYVGSVDLVQLLTGLIDEYDRLTGRTTAPEVTADDLARCAALTKAGAL